MANRISEITSAPSNMERLAIYNGAVKLLTPTDRERVPWNGVEHFRLLRTGKEMEGPDAHSIRMAEIPMGMTVLVIRNGLYLPLMEDRNGLELLARWKAFRALHRVRHDVILEHSSSRAAMAWDLEIRLLGYTIESKYGGVYHCLAPEDLGALPSVEEVQQHLATLAKERAEPSTEQWQGGDTWTRWPMRRQWFTDQAAAQAAPVPEGFDPIGNGLEGFSRDLQGVPGWSRLLQGPDEARYTAS